MIKKIVLTVVVLVTLMVLAIAAYVITAQTERPDISPKINSVVRNSEYQVKSTQAVDWMQSLYNQHNLPSFSVAVGINGQLVWQGVMGYADLDDATPADESTSYRIGSISKSMTAVAVMRLQEKGILNIDNSFGYYVKNYSTAHEKITLKQFLSHQSGVRHYIDELSENFSFTEYQNSREAATIVAQDPLLFEPGKGFNYTTYGYTFLSLVMEEASAKPFDIIMQEELFSPVGLQTTRLNKATESFPDLSTPYIEIDHSLYKSPEPNVSNKYAGGGILSTPSDMVKFGNALLDKSFIKKETRELLWTPVALANGDMNPENYALGFRAGNDDLGRFVHHGGKSVGGYSFLLIYPETKLVIAFATNVTPGNNSFDRLKEAQKLASIFTSNSISRYKNSL